jgi:hypothetical protein
VSFMRSGMLLKEFCRVRDGGCAYANLAVDPSGGREPAATVSDSSTPSSTIIVQFIFLEAENSLNSCQTASVLSLRPEKVVTGQLPPNTRPHILGCSNSRDVLGRTCS